MWDRGVFFPLRRCPLGSPYAYAADAADGAADAGAGATAPAPLFSCPRFAEVVLMAWYYRYW